MTPNDEEQLRLLSIFHYVIGGLSGFCACLPVLHLAIGIAAVTGKFDAPPGKAEFPAVFGWIFIGAASAAILLGWCYAIAVMVAGRQLQARKNHTFCLVVAAFSCMNVPLGTVLGVLSILVLTRPAVKDAFGAGIVKETYGDLA